MRTVRAVGWTGMLLAVSMVAAPVVAPAQPPDLDGDDRSAIVNQVAAALRANYVFPDQAETMADLLERTLDSGAYDGIGDVPSFCQRLTRDLHTVRHDSHLHVDPSPPRPADPGPEQRAELERRRQLSMRRDNHAFRKVELLPGNVGYLRLDGFVDARFAGPTAVAAMGFLANADAVIFDLRFNGGGEPSMVQLLSSYLFDQPTHLNSFHMRSSDSTQQFWTQAHVPGPRLSGVPLYVLTSSHTFSAAEEFAYNLKSLERATIVGETTGGGAHPTGHFPIRGYPIAVSVPWGRAVNPVTGTNWEGTGVAPHIEAPAERALEVAHLAALDALIATEEDPEHRERLRCARAQVAVAAAPEVLDEDSRQANVGTFGSPRTPR